MGLRDPYGGESTVTTVFDPTHIEGFEITRAADADNDVTIAAGTCRDSSHQKNMSSTSAMTKQIDATWAVGDNAGGRFSGVTLSANTVYYLFAILKTADNTVDYGWDTDPDAANKPAGYGHYRRIAQCQTGGSSEIDSIYQAHLTYTKIISRTSTAFTLALGDHNTIIRYNNASAGTATVPLNDTVELPNGFTVVFEQQGAGKLTVSPEGGVTLESIGGLVTGGVGTLISATKAEEDVWLVRAYPNLIGPGYAVNLSHVDNAAAASVTLNLANGLSQSVDIDQTTTIGVSNMEHGMTGTIDLYNQTGSSETVAFTSDFDWGGSAPTSVSAGKRRKISYAVYTDHAGTPVTRIECHDLGEFDNP